MLEGAITAEAVGLMSLAATGAGAIVALYKARPERTATVVSYQGEVLEDLNAELQRRRAVELELREELEQERVERRKLETEVRDRDGTIRNLLDRVASLEARLEGHS